MRIHMYMHTATPTVHAHGYMLTHTHTQLAQLHSHTYIFTHSHRNIYIQPHLHSHIHPPTCTHTCIRACPCFLQFDLITSLSTIRIVEYYNKSNEMPQMYSQAFQHIAIAKGI